MKTIVFVESNTTGTGELFFKRAEELGFSTLFLTRNPKLYSEAFSQFEQLSCNTNCPDEIIETLSKEKVEVWAIYSSSEYYIHICSIVARRLGLPGPNPEAIGICRNKYLAREVLKTHGISVPWFTKLSKLEELNEIEDTRFPLIIKPTMDSGSQGVKVVCSLDEAREHARNLLDKKQNIRNQPIPSYILLEEYIEGQEYSVETFAFNGKNYLVGVTQKLLDLNSDVLEVGHDFPVVDPTIASLLEQATQDSLQSVGLDWGPSHTEIRMRNNLPYIIEINPRLAGGMIPKLIQDSIGIDMIADTMMLIARQKNKFEFTPKFHKYSSIRFIIPNRDGHIKSVSIPENSQGCEIVLYQPKIASYFRKSWDFRDRIGHVITVDKDPRKAASHAQAILKEVHIHYVEQ